VSGDRQKIILGSRGSDLARAQAKLVVDKLRGCRPDLAIEIKVIRTRGDESKAAITDLRAGRKGLFTGEIERALIAGEVDLAVHSAKDLPSNLAAGTKIGAVLPRARVDDVLVMRMPRTLKTLPQAGVVATGSVRRKSQLRWQRPDLNISDLRGNVPTRLRKLGESDWDAIVLARAGLERLGLDLNENRIDFEGQMFWIEVLPQELFLPAGGQGVIAIQARPANLDAERWLREIDDRKTHDCLRAEREFLRLLDADCNRPVGVLATIAQPTMTVRVQIFDDGTIEPRTASVEGRSEEAEKLAAELFRKINR
jgi:hydroxymethylbilane synthase